jgi:hypothetical protein
MKEKLYNFNTKLTLSEHNMLRELKDKYAVNISQAFKLFIKEYFLKMENFRREENKQG